MPFPLDPNAPRIAHPDDIEAVMTELPAPTHHLDRAGYHFCRAWCCCAAGNMPEALSNARQAVQRARRAGAVFPIAVTRMGLAQLHLERGLPHLALWQMGRVGLTGRSMAEIAGLLSMMSRASSPSSAVSMEYP